MSDKVTFNVQKREGTGKGVSRKLRAAGMIPGVCYGNANDSFAVSADPKVLYKLLTGPARTNIVFALAVEGGETFNHVMVREYQVDPVRRTLVHADFVVVDPAKALTVTVPVVPKGVSLGVKAGGNFRSVRPEVVVSALPDDIPVNVTYDVTGMNIEDALMASELELPEGVSPAYKVDYSIFQVAMARGAEVETEEEAEAEAEA